MKCRGTDPGIVIKDIGTDIGIIMKLYSTGWVQILDKIILIIPGIRDEEFFFSRSAGCRLTAPESSGEATSLELLDLLPLSGY